MPGIPDIPVTAGFLCFLALAGGIVPKSHNASVNERAVLMLPADFV